MKRDWLTATVWLLLVVHIVWGAARLPTRVAQRRSEEIALYRRDPAAFFLDGDHLRGAEVVHWLQQNVPPDSVLLWHGDYAGAIEFVPALLLPRLLVSDAVCPPERVSYAGRQVARGSRGGRTGTLVLVGSRDAITLEVR